MIAAGFGPYPPQPDHPPGHRGGGLLADQHRLPDRFPQQTRALRVLATAGGGVAIQTWMLDHVLPGELGTISRQLAYLDAQGGRPEDSAGHRSDRNVTLYRGPVAGMSTTVAATDRPQSASGRSPARSRLGDRLAGVVVAVAAAAPVLAYAWVALHRVGYPFELDWMEGGSVELAARVAGGHSLYTAPSLAFVGWTYTPLYYWLSAGVAKLIGVGFAPLRLVSLVASLVAMATLAWMVLRETGSRLAGLIAAGLFAASFRISGAWFDTGRVDSLFLALTLLTLAWGRRAESVRGGLGLGVLAFLAYFTKQSALVAVAPGPVVRRRRAATRRGQRGNHAAGPGGRVHGGSRRRERRLVPVLRVRRAVRTALGAGGVGQLLEP